MRPLPILAITILLATASTPLSGQEPIPVPKLEKPQSTLPISNACAPRPDVGKRLRDSYGEGVIWLGISNTGALIELFSSSSTGSWTLLATFPNLRSCIVGVGERSLSKLDSISLTLPSTPASFASPDRGE